MAISMVGYILFMAAHFHPSWELFVPAAIAVGLGGGPLWTAQSHYLNIVSAGKYYGIGKSAGKNHRLVGMHRSL